MARKKGYLYIKKLKGQKNCQICKKKHPKVFFGAKYRITFKYNEKKESLYVCAIHYQNDIKPVLDEFIVSYSLVHGDKVKYTVLKDGTARYTIPVIDGVFVFYKNQVING